MNTNHIRWVYGVDFSGAREAGRKIWIATGLIRGKVLEITDCRPAKELSGSGKELQKCLTALVDFISGQCEAIFGMDFPFGIPAPLLKENSWKKYILSFRGMFSNPDQFKEEYFSSANNSELKRATDKEWGTPFSVYNRRLYKQTYYGIREIIDPLVREDRACFLPMQEPASGRPWVVEICPAVTLKNEGLYSSPYKHKTPECSQQRLRILRKIEETGNLRIPEGLKTTILSNYSGDALDSIIAAFATFRSLPNLFSLSVKKKPIYMLEGYVYA